MSDLVCKFCGHKLTRPGPGSNHIFTVLSRGERRIESVAGILANPGECLNAAGQLTKHHPDAPEWNGGIDYSDRTPLGGAFL